MIPVLLEALGLKALPRTGWVRRGISDPESVAAHSWGVSWLVLVLLPESLDLARALTYATLHDLPEVRIGDLTPEDGVDPDDKAAREHRAMAGLMATVPPGDRLRAAWEAYEAQSDPEARFVRQLDRLDMALQAVAYAEKAPDGAPFDPADFLESAAAVIEDPQLVSILDAIESRLALGPADP